MYLQKKLFISLVLLLVPFLVNAQYYSSGADPANIKWNKIETENFKLVFPEDFKEKGQYLAKVLEEVYKYGGLSLKHKPKKIDVLVHAETAYSNGFVTWAPKRIELYNNPNQHMYAQDWLQQLALHEFRHVVQLDKLNDGFTKILSYILGEQAVGAVVGAFVPMWFLEGDAVVTETALTKSGRGRSPWFEQGMRAQIMGKQIYSYEKAMFGSYKDYVPNHYEMGYQMVAGARAKYGEDIWEKALYNTGRNPFTIIPFNNGQKQLSSLNKVGLYSSTFTDLQQKWEQQDTQTKKSKFVQITEASDSYINYEYACVAGASGYIAELSGMAELRRFVSIDENGVVSTLFTPGSRGDEPFSYADNTICWGELEPDPRWENRMYSVIKCYHIPTKKLHKVTRKSRYFSPAISPDGKRIAVVSVDNQNNYRLVVLDKEKGSVLKEFEHGDNSYLYTPSWNKEGTQLVCVALSSEGKALTVLDMESGQWQQITEPSHADVSLPSWGKDSEILFTAGYSGTEEIYSVLNNEIKQLTQSKYGATGALVVEDQLVYSYYTADGFQLVKTDVEDCLNVALDDVKDNSLKLHKEIAKQEILKPDFSTIDSLSDYEVKKYSKWNLFNIHSWAPAFVNVNDQKVSLFGATAMSQNLLGTATTSIGYNGDTQMSREKYYFNFEYQAWYPVFNFEIKHGDERVEKGVYVDEVDTFYINKPTKEYYTEIETGLSLPLNLSRGKYYSLLKPTIDYNQIYRSGYTTDRILATKSDDKLVAKSNPEAYSKDDFTYSSFEYSLYFHHLLRSSQRDVTYRWGQIAEVIYQSTPWGNVDAGGIVGLYSKLYFPGFLQHHSISLGNNYQHKLLGEERKSNSDLRSFYKFGDYFNFPRGYNRYENDKMYSFKGDYIFPLCDPDLNLPGIFYLKRVTTNLFFDYSRTYQELKYVSGETLKLDNSYSSTGFELRGELHALRFMFPVTVGCRYARLLELDENKFEFLLGINISGFSIGE